MERRLRGPAEGVVHRISTRENKRKSTIKKKNTFFLVTSDVEGNTKKSMESRLQGPT